MPLHLGLMNVILSHPCPHCGLTLKMKGSWFCPKANYACASCHQLVPMRYPEKTALFAKHAHLARGGVDDRPPPDFSVTCTGNPTTHSPQCVKVFGFEWQPRPQRRRRPAVRTTR